MAADGGLRAAELPQRNCPLQRLSQRSEAAAALDRASGTHSLNIIGLKAVPTIAFGAGSPFDANLEAEEELAREDA
jgi:hypothetical protein